MDANEIEPRETVPASRKLGRADAAALVGAARRVMVAKGKAVQVFDPTRAAQADVVAAMLGPTGNLRAPTVRVGTTLVVGFDESTYRDVML